MRGFGLGEQFYRHQQLIQPFIDTGSFTFEIGSILDKTALVLAMRGCDAVVHLAAMMGPKTEIQRLRCFDINVNGIQNVLAAAVSCGVKKIITASSSAVYGEPARNPVPETGDMKPINIYGVTKLAAEEVTRCFAYEYPVMDFTIARLFNVYGELGGGQLAIEAFVSQVLKNENPKVSGDGKQTRCFTHVDDIANGLMAILDSTIARDKTYNLGNPSQAISIVDLAHRVIEVVAPNRGLTVEMLPSAECHSRKEIRESYADITLARKELGYEPVVTLDEGLNRMSQAATSPGI